MATNRHQGPAPVAPSECVQSSSPTRDPTNEGIGTPPSSHCPSRPPMANCEHSAHVYKLPDRTPSQLECGPPEPRVAHIRRGGSESLPLESVVTVRPGRGMLRPSAPDRGLSELSIASSGVTLTEVSVPEAVRTELESHSPGTYRCTFTDLSKKKESLDCIDGIPDEKATIVFEVQRLDTYDNVTASREQLESLTQSHPIPVVQGPVWLNRLRYGFFSTYRRLFAFILTVNLAVIVTMAIRASQHRPSFTYADATTAVAANLFAAMLLRHEHFINLVFRMSLSVPHWLPVSIRRYAAKCYSYGGVHSACGVSAALWYVFFAALVIDDFVTENDGEGEAVAVLTACMLFVLATLLTMSLPQVRREFHDAWEMSHRFAGWTALALIWAQTILIAFPTARLQHTSTGLILAKTPAFWLLIASTYLLVYPWVRMRHYSVEHEHLSNHAVRLHFHGRRLSTCMGVKLSDSPLTENHGFATIPDPDGGKGFSCIVSDAGDWTKKVINEPPKKLWIRGVPVMGVMRLCLAFRRIVVVATGSGIGPCMSFLAVHPEWDCRIIWSARMPVMTFGETIMESVLKADENALIIDSQRMQKPKPKLADVAYAVYKDSGAEAVVIISNPSATQSVVYALESRKVPAYGAIFDS